MKRKSIIIASLFLFVILLTTKVNAADEACKISLSADKTTVEQGDTVTINVLISNVTKSTGIGQFYGILEYPENIFEPVLDDDTSIKSDYTEYANYSILYSGRQDDTNKNPWYIVLVKQGNQNGFLASMDTKFSSDSNGAKEIKPGESQIIGKIKLKVKDSVTGTTTKVLLSDMEVFGPETTGDTTTDTPKGDAISDASISLTIKEPTKDGTPIVSDIPKSEVKQNQNKNANIASNEVPYTGIEDTIPVIFILAIISVLAYINYKKYKNI